MPSPAFFAPLTMVGAFILVRDGRETVSLDNWKQEYAT